MMPLRSRRHEVADPVEANELFQRNGWADRFAESARIMAEALGLPGYPFALIPHPISSDGDPGLRAKAEEAVQQCVQILTRR